MPHKDPVEYVAYRARYRELNREELRVAALEYGQTHREEKKIYDQQYRETHKAQLQAAKAKYRKANRIAIKAKETLFRETHRERIKEQRARRHAAHPERQKAYRAKRMPYILTMNARRQARKRGLPATLTLEQWEAIKRLYKGRCAYCGEKVKKLTQDHMIPLSKGGGTTAGNIVPACLSCNSRKKDQEPPAPHLRLLLL